ncbi:aminoglycoside phosphotransferase family protein [Actinomadura sp. DC4]|uniref:phosphotransferase family protein n=1 Tax=Actinomadura sp. DC4 TaxID=3055069 RepID=UPI0025B09326|nr:aminoglycoside phosphotransferase family protein [Actinomadura sp. DC4]MDN3354160.1 aminoglycoside phosphotransferase family protein [Actinomadura sp. DC4]
MGGANPAGGHYLDVTPAKIVTSAVGIDDAGLALASGLSTLVTALHGLGSPWGNDSLGQVFFNGEGRSIGFRDARDATVDGLWQLSLALRGHAVKAVRMAQIYAEAEPDGDNPAFNLHLGGARSPQTPPPAGGFTAGLVHDDPPPPGTEWLFGLLEELVVGCKPPAGDAAGMDAVATAFDAMADVVDYVTGEATAHAKAITSNNAGAGIEGFAVSFARLAQTGSGHLIDIARACRAIAAYCRHLAVEIRSAKTQFTASVVLLAALWATARLLSMAPGGALAQLPALMETRNVGVALVRMMRSAAVRTAAAAAVYVGGLNTVGQLTREHYGLQTEFDWKNLTESTGLAALGGGLMGAANVRLANAAAAGDPFADFLANRLPGRIVTNTALGFGANVGADAALNDGRVDWGRDLLMAGGMAVNAEALGAFRTPQETVGDGPLLGSDHDGGLPMPETSSSDHTALAGHTDTGPPPAAHSAMEGATHLRSDDGVLAAPQVRAYMDGLPPVPGLGGASDASTLAAMAAGPPRSPGAEVRSALTDFSGRSAGIPSDRVTIDRVGGGDGPRGRSGAPVFLVRDTAGEGVAAITKLFPKPEEFIREMSVTERFDRPEFTRFRVPEVLDVGAAHVGEGVPAGVATFSVAPGDALVDHFQSVRDAPAGDRAAEFETLRQATGKIAEGLADLHSNTLVEGRTARPEYLGEYMDNLSGFADHLVTHRQAYESQGIPVDRLHDGIRQVLDEMRRDPGPASVLHGDPNPGNFFYDKTDGSVTFIDLGNSDKSMDADGAGIAPPSRDVEMFRHDLEVYSRMFDLPKSDFAELWRHFQASYTAAGGPAIPDVAYRFSAVHDSVHTIVNAPKLAQAMPEHELRARRGVATDQLRELGLL